MENEIIIELEKRIEGIELELRELKKKLAVLEVVDGNIVGSISEDEICLYWLNLSWDSIRILKRKKINTLKDLLLNSSSDLGYEAILKIKQYQSDPAGVIKKAKEIRDAQKEDYELICKFFGIPIEVYNKMRKKAKEENICFNQLGKRTGVFGYIYKKEDSIKRKMKDYRSGNYDEYASGIFNRYPASDFHPSVVKMLNANKITLDLVKEAIEEDLKESVKESLLKEESKTYQDFLKFLQIIKEF